MSSQNSSPRQLLRQSYSVRIHHMRNESAGAATLVSETSQAVDGSNPASPVQLHLPADPTSRQHKRRATSQVEFGRLGVSVRHSTLRDMAMVAEKSTSRATPTSVALADGQVGLAVPHSAVQQCGHSGSSLLLPIERVPRPFG